MHSQRQKPIYFFSRGSDTISHIEYLSLIVQIQKLTSLLYISRNTEAPL